MGTAQQPTSRSFNKGLYYLICHLEPYNDPACLHVKRICALTVDDKDHTIVCTLDIFTGPNGAPMDINDFLDERPYPSPSTPGPGRLLAEGGLEPVFDWFTDVKAKKTGEDSYEATVGNQ